MKTKHSKNKYSKNKKLTIPLKPVDMFVNFAKTSNSVTLPVAGIGLMTKSISTGVVCGFMFGKGVKIELVIQNNNKAQKEM